MLLIRKFVGYGATAVGLGVISALALVQAGEAAGPPTNGSIQVPTASVELPAATPSPQCTAALNAIKTAGTQDAIEDTSERATTRTNLDAPADLSEDQSEHAAMTSLRDAARAACLPPATPQCSAALSAVQSAQGHDQTEDASERAIAKTSASDAVDVNEDTSERAALKALFDSVRAACGPRRLPTTAGAAPTSQCVAAQQALKAAIAQDKAANAAEAGAEGTAADMSEDKAEMAQIFSLMKSVGTACGFSREGDSFRTDFFTTDSFRR
jgi:transposase